MSSHPLAVEGFDVVAYQTEGHAVEGSPAHTHAWGGRTWRFASDAHRAAFARDPERYAPQYDGHCAFGVSIGQRAPGSPRHWRVVDDRLFLQSNAAVAFLFGLLPGRRRAADAKWEASA